MRRGRPCNRPPLPDQLTLRLCADETWQHIFTPAECTLWIDAAARYFKLQRQAGLNLDESYQRVLAMLTAATLYEDGKDAMLQVDDDSSARARG